MGIDSSASRASQRDGAVTPGSVILELEPVADPLARPGVPARDASLRLRMALKRLLRDHGLRCRRLMDSAKVLVIIRPEDAAAATPGATEPTQGDECDG